VTVRFAWTGSPAEGEAVLAPIRDVAPLIFGTVGELPSDAMGVIHSDPLDPMPTAERAVLLSGLPQEAVTALLAVGGPAADCPLVVVELRQLGGAVALGTRDDGSLCNRDAAFTLLGIGIAAGPAAEATSAAEEAIVRAVEPWDTGRQMPNFAPSLDPEQVWRIDDPTCSTGSRCSSTDSIRTASSARPIRSGRRASRAERRGAGRVGPHPVRHSCSSSPSLFRTCFSPASMRNGKRFCFGGIGQLKL